MLNLYFSPRSLWFMVICWPSRKTVRKNQLLEKMSCKMVVSFRHEITKFSPSTCLRNLSMQMPSVESPSHSSISTVVSQTPGAQEVLTAFLLIELLSAPGRTMPLNKLKDVLAEKKSSIVMAQGVTPTRILYACVGKRLIKIDRSGGEQLAKFDC